MTLPLILPRRLAPNTPQHFYLADTHSPPLTLGVRGCPYHLGKSGKKGRRGHKKAREGETPATAEGDERMSWGLDQRSAGRPPGITVQRQRFRAIYMLIRSISLPALFAAAHFMLQIIIKLLPARPRQITPVPDSLSLRLPITHFSALPALPSQLYKHTFSSSPFLSPPLLPLSVSPFPSFFLSITNHFSPDMLIRGEHTQHGRRRRPRRHSTQDTTHTPTRSSSKGGFPFSGIET